MMISRLGFFVKLLILVCFLAPLCNADNNKADSRNNLRSQQIMQQAQIINTNKTLSKHKSKLRSEKRKIRKENKQLKRINMDLARLNADIERLALDLQSYNKDKTDLLLELDEVRQVLYHHIRIYHALARQGQLKVILSQPELFNLGRSMSYIEYLNKSGQHQVELLTKLQTQVDTIVVQIKAKQLAILMEQTQHQQDQILISAVNKKRVKNVAVLTKKIASKKIKLKKLERDNYNLNRLLNNFNTQSKVAIGAKGFARLKNKLNWPSKGKIVRLFDNPAENGAIQSRGVIIDAKQGSKVKAIAKGKVLFANYMKGFGLLTIIDHGEGYMSLYGNNEGLIKQVGKEVERDEAISYVGLQEGSQKPGLYFEIRKDGKPLDPSLWCASRSN